MTTSVNNRKEDKRTLNVTQDSVYLYRSKGVGYAKERKDDGIYEEADKFSKRSVETEGTTQDLSESTAAESETSSPMPAAKKSVGFSFNNTESDTSPAKKHGGFFYNMTHPLQGKSGGKHE
jgi:hypothetical protein